MYTYYLQISPEMLSESEIRAYFFKGTVSQKSRFEPECYPHGTLQIQDFFLRLL